MAPVASRHSFDVGEDGVEELCGGLHLFLGGSVAVDAEQAVLFIVGHDDPEGF